jgi:hypothetical protein
VRLVSYANAREVLERAQACLVGDGAASAGADVARASEPATSLTPGA